MLLEIQKTIKLSFPLIITQFTQMGIGVTDTLMMGWLGTTELAALTLASTLLFILYIWIYGFPNASVALISQAQGRQDATFARRAFRMGLWAVILSSSVSITILSQTDLILRFFGQKEELISLASQYMAIAKWMILPFMIFTMVRAFMMSIDRVYIIFWISVFGLLLNALVNYMLIFGNLGAPQLEIQGAAFASVISGLAMMVLMVCYTFLSKSIRNFELFKRIFKPDSKALLQVIKMGFPIGLTTLAEVGSFSAAAVIMGWIGKIELAAHGILMQIFGLAFMIPLGISQAATIRVGTALGEENKEKIYEASKSIYILGMGFGVLIIFTLILGGEFFINLFLDRRLADSDEVLRFASIFLFIGIIFHIFDCGQILAIGLLRGLSDTKVPFYLCLLSYWGVGIPVAYILSIHLGLGGSGIWIGLGIGMGFCFATLGYRFKLLKTKL